MIPRAANQQNITSTVVSRFIAAQNPSAVSRLSALHFDLSAGVVFSMRKGSHTELRLSADVYNEP
jgi:hypothetical protein